MKSDRMSSLFIDAAAAPVWVRLNQAITRAEQEGRRIPCRAANIDAWHSKAGEDIEYAEQQCQTCPVLTQCGSYADAAGERYGVWGGTNRTVPMGRPPVETGQRELFRLPKRETA